MTYTFAPAKFEAVTVKIGISGPQASGKTVSALMIAKGLGGKTALIDTENKRSQKYANDFSFDILALEPPFNPSRYKEAIQAAEKAGYDNIIIDSLSHEHEGQGGLIDMHEAQLQKIAGNDWAKRERVKFTAWIKPKQERNALLQVIQRSKANIIMCCRAKDKLAMLKNSEGKNEPVSVGDTPICGQEFPFEMDVFFMLPAGAKGKPDWDNPNARINTLDPQFQQSIHGQITVETGKKISDWAKGPVEEKQTEPQETKEVQNPLTDEEWKNIQEDVNEASTIPDLETAGEKVKEMKERLTAEQSASLKSLYASNLKYLKEQVAA